MSTSERIFGKLVSVMDKPLLLDEDIGPITRRRSVTVVITAYGVWMSSSEKFSCRCQKVWCTRYGVIAQFNVDVCCRSQFATSHRAHSIVARPHLPSTLWSFGFNNIGRLTLTVRSNTLYWYTIDLDFCPKYRRYAGPWALPTINVTNSVALATGMHFTALCLYLADGYTLSDVLTNCHVLSCSLRCLLTLSLAGCSRNNKLWINVCNWQYDLTCTHVHGIRR